MVTAPDSSANHHSPTAAGDTNSPKFPRKNLPSPWAQVVRGGESESLSGTHQSPPSSSSAFSSSSSLSSLTISVFDHPPPSDSIPKAAPASPPLDNSNTAAADSSDPNNGNAGRSKKTAWNKLANGDVEVSPVMGAVSWPALSESTKASAKLSAESSSKASTDGSLPSSQAPVTSHAPHKQVASNAKPNFATNHSTYNRPRSMMKRGGGSSIGAGPAQNSFSGPPQPPPPPPFPVFQIPPSSYNTVVPGVPDPSSREFLYKKNSWDTRPSVGGFMPVVNDHRNSSRRGNFVPHPRSDGSYHNNYGGRRDQDRGNYANNRDAHVNQQRMPPRGLVRHLPPNTGAFVAPQPLAPFANPVGFPEYYYFPTLPLEPFRGMPFITHGPPPAMFFPVAESPLSNMILNQIDYYFSEANLVKDEFLKSNMDEQGWVSISLIAGFPRVKSLTSNIQLILDSLRTSTVVEVQGDKVRRRNGRCKTWPLPSSQVRVDSALASPGGSSHSNLVADFQKIAMEESTADKVNSSPTSEIYQARYATKASGQSQLLNGDATGNSN